jgi:hypothetical protein
MFTRSARLMCTGREVILRCVDPEGPDEQFPMQNIKSHRRYRWRVGRLIVCAVLRSSP